MTRNLLSCVLLLASLHSDYFLRLWRAVPSLAMPKGFKIAPLSCVQFKSRKEQREPWAVALFVCGCSCFASIPYAASLRKAHHIGLESSWQCVMGLARVRTLEPTVQHTPHEVDMHVHHRTRVSGVGTSALPAPSSAPHAFSRATAHIHTRSSTVCSTTRYRQICQPLP